ncbi:MAG: ABC transporter permease [Myxococcales bacterium]|jgi:ABC-2 type transport system permease protein
MHKTLTIAKREFLGYLNGPAAYIVVCLFLLVLGLFFWTPFFIDARASVRGMFELMPILFLLTAPAISMGQLADEKRTGTVEVLLTMPLRDIEVVVGKYLGALGLLFVLLLLTLPYPMSVGSLGDLDWGPVWTGYLAAFLLSGTMVAIGLLASSWTENQLIAFFAGAVISFAFFIVSRFLPFLPQQMASAVEWASFDFHYSGMLRGVLDTRDIFYFLSLIGLCLAMATRSLESRRWS